MLCHPYGFFFGLFVGILSVLEACKCEQQHDMNSLSGEEAEVGTESKLAFKECVSPQSLSPCLLFFEMPGVLAQPIFFSFPAFPFSFS